MEDPAVKKGGGGKPSVATAPAPDMLDSVTVTVAPGHTVSIGELREVASTDRPGEVIRVALPKTYGPGSTLQVSADEAARLLKRGVILPADAPTPAAAPDGLVIKTDTDLKITTA
jgi:hypothetical protein